MLCLFNCEEEWPYFNKNNKKGKKKQSAGANMINNSQSVKTCHWPWFCTVHVYDVVVSIKMHCFFHWGKSVLAYFFFFIVYLFLFVFWRTKFQKGGCGNHINQFNPPPQFLHVPSQDQDFHGPLVVIPAEFLKPFI